MGDVYCDCWWTAEGLDLVSLWKQEALKDVGWGGLVFWGKIQNQGRFAWAVWYLHQKVMTPDILKINTAYQGRKPSNFETNELYAIIMVRGS